MHAHQSLVGGIFKDPNAGISTPRRRHCDRARARTATSACRFSMIASIHTLLHILGYQRATPPAKHVTITIMDNLLFLSLLRTSTIILPLALLSFARQQNARIVPNFCVRIDSNAPNHTFIRGPACLAVVVCASALPSEWRRRVSVNYKISKK
jgi:hypothetical protein